MIDTNIFQNKTAVYYTLGCKLNFSETSTIGKILREAGVRTARKGNPGAKSQGIKQFMDN